MPKICYVPRDFSAASLAIVESANSIIEDYQDAGYKLTLRQLYYQFVSKDLLPNTIQNYKRLGSIVNDARLAGLIDWDAIEDRTRNLASLAHWSGPEEIVESCAAQFRTDRWAGQPCRVEVWIEKEALAGVFERVCEEYDVPFLCCRGYPAGLASTHLAVTGLTLADPSGTNPTAPTGVLPPALRSVSSHYFLFSAFRSNACRMSSARNGPTLPSPLVVCCNSASILASSSGSSATV